MDDLIQKISVYLQENPNSNARSICKEIGADKSDVNRCLYANEGARFSKEGLTPPLWQNINDSSSTKTADVGIAEVNGSESGEELEMEDSNDSPNADEDWTRLDAEDQKAYLVIKTLTALGVNISKQDRSRMNQLNHRIQQAIRSETISIESAKRKIKNRAENLANVDEEVAKLWSVEEQRVQAIAALSLQFESNLRRMAYGCLLLSKGVNPEHENGSDVENQKFKGNNLIKSVSSTINTRLGNLENMLDEDLVISTVRFAWFNRDQTSRPDSMSPTEMYPQFEEIEEVIIYRSRFKKIVQRIKEA